MVGFLFISSGSGRTYFEASRAGAAVFLLLQLVAILDAVYSANERWLERAEAGEAGYKLRLAALAIVTNGGTIAGARSRSKNTRTHPTHSFPRPDRQS